MTLSGKPTEQASLQPEPELLFVYGTLRRGCRNPEQAFLEAHAEFIAEGTFQGRLFSAGAFPAAVRSEDDRDAVRGEVYRIKDMEALWAQLDEYEGCHPIGSSGSLFRRERVEVKLRGGRSVLSWMYLYNRPTDELHRIVSGDFLRESGDDCASAGR